MKHTKRFDNAMSALVKGFFDETLAKGSCAACAVGNIIAHSIGGTIKKTTVGIDEEIVFRCNQPNTHWSKLFMTVKNTIRLEMPNGDKVKELPMGYNQYSANEGELLVSSSNSIPGMTSVPIHTLKNESRTHAKWILSRARKMIEKTGYTKGELMEIEYAFETHTEIMVSEYNLFPQEEIIEDQLKGLTAVVDVLCNLEPVAVEEKERKELKAVFAIGTAK